MADGTYIILLSGPLSTHRQTEDAVRSAGLGVIPHDPRRHNYGYSATDDGSEDPTVGFVPVRAAHPDDLAALFGTAERPGPLAAYGWTQRGHWPEPPPAPQIEMVPAGTLERLDRVEKALAAKGLI